MIDTLYPIVLLIMTATVGTAVPMLFMLRVVIKRHRGLGVGIIILDALLTLKALVVFCGIALTWPLITRHDGEINRHVLSIVLILMSLQAWVTVVRLVYWWMDQRRNVGGLS